MEYDFYLRRAARLYGPKVAVRAHDDAEELTYKELDERADAIARYLIAQGLSKGERVATMHANSPRVLEVDFGTARSGGVRVPINARASAEEVTYIVNHSGAKVVILDESFADLVPQLRERIDGDPLYVGYGSHVDASYEEIFAASGRWADEQFPEINGEDLLSLKYTGGSTGQPKGTIRTHRAQEAIALNILLDLYPFATDDVLLQVQPLSHGAGAFILPSIMRGATQVTMREFDAAQAADLLKKAKVNVVKLVPTMLYRILDQFSEPLPDSVGLRAIMFGASPISEDGIRRSHEIFGPRIVQTYGQTEAPVTITCYNASEYFEARQRGLERGRSVGRPYSTVDVEIRGDDGSEVPIGEVGRVYARGPMLMDGYWNSDVVAFDDAGWLDTGDIGKMDADNYLYLVDRANDMLISGGFNVYPREVEVELEGHDHVAQAVVFGVPHPDWGEAVITVIVPIPGIDVDLQAVDIHLRATLSAYKVPKKYIVTDRLPLSPVGKVTRKLVKSTLAEELGDVTAMTERHIVWDRTASDE